MVKGCFVNDPSFGNTFIIAGPGLPFGVNIKWCPFESFSGLFRPTAFCHKFDMYTSAVNEIYTY